MWDKEAQAVVTRATTGNQDGQVAYKAGEGLVGAVFEAQTPAIVEQAFDDERFNSMVDSHLDPSTRNLL